MKTKATFSATTMLLFLTPFTFLGQVKVTYGYAENQELLDYFQFEGIQYLKMSFTGKELPNKTYCLSVKEIWDGEVKKESNIFDSKNFPYMQLKTVGDTIFNIRIISKFSAENKLTMSFNFPTHSTKRSFEATSLDNYVLRPVYRTQTAEIGEKFYLLVYMLPYEVKIEGGVMQQYCAVENSGYEIETWGKEFGIKHYLVFEMKFESL